MSNLGLSVPGLSQDLWPQRETLTVRGGPGSRPGRGLQTLNLDAANLRHGSVCLHHGVPTRRRNLHRSHRESFRARRGASRWLVGSYCQIQNTHLGLVRGARRFCGQFATGAGDQALAKAMEECVDSRTQSELAGCDRAYSILGSSRPGLDPGSLSVSCATLTKRSRVKPGT